MNIMNYKKTEHFEPIAMKCTQEQFESIKTILINNKLYLNCVSKFDIYPYLVNFGEQNSKTINNIHKKGFGYIWDLKHCLYETFNAETFLKACGIVSEPLYKLTSKEIRYGEENPQWLKDTFKECFETELVIGKYYIRKRNRKCIINFQGENNKNYGFGALGNYSIGWALDEDNSMDFEPATEKEVEEALVKEAIKRGYKEGVTIKNHQGSFVLNELDFVLSDGKYNDGIWTRQGSGVWIFFNGVWSDIVTPTYTIPEAEYKFNIKIKADV